MLLFYNNNMEHLNIKKLICTRCNFEKNYDQFRYDKNKKNGKRSICRECDCREQREYRKNNKEKVNYLNRLRNSREDVYMARKYQAIKNPSTRRKIYPVELSKQDFLNLWEEHKKKYNGPFCAISGVKMTTKTSTNGVKNLTNISVDRLNPEIGYTKNNIIFITWEVNARKCNVTFKDCEKILELKKEKENEQKS